MKWTGAFFTLVILLAAMPEPVHATETFRFESIADINEMTGFISRKFPLGTGRDALRQAFVAEGGATLKAHPVTPATEKYIYDINLCGYYIWRWNISADYDSGGLLQQAYMNGNIVFPEGVIPPPIFKKGAEGKKASIYKAFRPRPEATKGENRLAYMLFDRDSDAKTITDQSAAGAGPSRPDPLDMGKMVVYAEVDPWRSIFDSDAADKINAYKGDCAAADELYKR